MKIDKNTSVFPLRRQVIKAFAGAALAGYARAQQCTTVGSPSLTEGPYFVDEDLIRSDIRVDPSDGSLQPGYPLSLTINVSQLSSCALTPLTGAYVDIWHCNAAGVYSDIAAQTSTGRRFLRGYQPTDRHGNAYFLTVYPGWYTGRAVHIHVKVRIFSLGAESYEFTSQFFFDDSFSDDVFTLAPYNTRGSRDTRNANDGIYSGASSTGTITTGSGSYLLLKLNKNASWADAEAKLVCDLSLGSSPDQSGGGGGGGGMGPGGPGGPPPGFTPPGV
jgi:protocatechuate 3,4-dioxygenase beta subunit